MPETMPQAFKDQILLLMKEHAKGVASDIVEQSYKQLEERNKELLDTNARAIRSSVENAKVRAFGIGALGHAVLRAKGDTDRAWKIAAEGPLGPEVTEELKAGHAQVQKTLQLGDATGGGVLVQGEMLDRFFETLLPKIAVLSLGPQILPMPSGNLAISGFTGDATSSYVGEVNTSEVSETPTTGQRLLNAKKQMVIVPVGNSLINSPPGSRIASYIEAQSIRRMAVPQDQKLIRGTGTQFSPKGLRYWAPAANQVPSGGVTLADVLADFGAALTALESANVPMEKMGVIFAPRVKNFLMFQVLETTTGRPFFMDEMRGGTILGMPFRSTSNVPVNLGGGTDSEIIIADFAQVLYGETGVMRVDWMNQASYTEGGVTVNSAERDEQILRLVHEHDLNVEHEEAVYVITGVGYGA